MDPEATLRKLRDSMIEVCDVLSGRLTVGPSELSDEELEKLSWAGHDINEAANDLIEWVGKGGFRPNGHGGR